MRRIIFIVGCVVFCAPALASARIRLECDSGLSGGAIFKKVAKDRTESGQEVVTGITYNNKTVVMNANEVSSSPLTSQWSLEVSDVPGVKETELVISTPKPGAPDSADFPGVLVYKIRGKSDFEFLDCRYLMLDSAGPE